MSNLDTKVDNMTDGTTVETIDVKDVIVKKKGRGRPKGRRNKKTRYRMLVLHPMTLWTEHPIVMEEHDYTSMSEIGNLLGVGKSTVNGWIHKRPRNLPFLITKIEEAEDLVMDTIDYIVEEEINEIITSLTELDINENTSDTD